MPNLNKGHYLRDAIESVLAQSYSNFELVIVDNGSSDESLQIIDECSKQDERIVCLHEPRRGPGWAKNLGIANSKGELVAFLDSDDLYHKDKLSQQVSIFEEQPHTYVCYTNGWIVDGSGVPTGQLYNRSSTLRAEREGHILRTLLRHNIVLQSSLMLRRECTQHAIFDPTIIFCEDYDLSVRLARRYHFTYIPEPLCGYRIYEGNTWSPSDQTLKRRNLREICKVYEKLLTDLDGLDYERQIVARRLMNNYRELGDYWGLLSLALTNRVAVTVAVKKLGRSLGNIRRNLREYP